MKKYIILILGVAVFAALGYFTYKKVYTLGLDLNGGVSLTYNVDTQALSANMNKNDALNSLKDIIERRVNALGVSEPNVYNSSALNGGTRLVVELPGVTDIDTAIKRIGDTPTLEFSTLIDIDIPGTTTKQQFFVGTGLTGKYLDKAQVKFDQNTNRPFVSLLFNEEGKKIFAKLTADNVGKPIAIMLDGNIISSPVVQEAITNGEASITSSNFTPKEVKELVGRLNGGALPLPITLESTSKMGATLGLKAFEDGEKAFIYGFILIAIFMLLWYRLPGLSATLSLLAYSILMLAIIKYLPVTLTAAGIAGLIISLGVAIDANVLIFERSKEEIKKGIAIKEAVKIGFDRAYTSIRDSNIASIIIAIILYWFGSGIVKSFALTFGVGVLISLISAMFITKNILILISPKSSSKISKFLFNSLI